MKEELHRVVPTAIIYKSNKFLILKRSLDKKVYPGKWSVPGGGLSTSDYLHIPKTTSDAWYGAVTASLKREIKEETNLEVSEPKYLIDMTFIRPDNIPVVVLSFYCEYKSGKIKLDSDNTDYAWVTAEEASGYDLIEGILDEIKMVDELLRV